MKDYFHSTRFGSSSLALLASVWLLLAGCGQTSMPPAGNVEQPRRNSGAAVAADPYDLARDEEQGGHTLNKHVGRSDEQLRERLRRERNISAASTWTDRETAEATVGEALRVERGRIENWMRHGYPRANLGLHFNADHPIGRSLQRGEQQTVNCTSAVIVLRADGPDTFYVLTTYPEARE